MRVAVLVLFTAGCTTTAANIADKPVRSTFESAKPPAQFALCVAENLRSPNDLRNDGDHYWVVINNANGEAGARWDFTPTPNGSKAESRAISSIATREDGKVRDCA